MIRNRESLSRIAFIFSSVRSVEPFSIAMMLQSYSRQLIENGKKPSSKFVDAIFFVIGAGNDRNRFACPVIHQVIPLLWL